MATEPAARDSTPMASDKITLHVLCPSIPAPGRFTLYDQPLSDTVAQIKARITQSLPSRPAPSQQRLIYRGKPLTDDRASLASVLGPIDGSPYSIHLVLPPAPTPTSSSTPGAADAAGVPSYLNPYVPSTGATPRLATSTQGIRYRGQSPFIATNNSNAQNSQERTNNVQGELDTMLERWRATSPSSLDRTSTLREELRRRGALSEEMDRILTDMRANSSYYNQTLLGHNAASTSYQSVNSANSRFPTTSSWNTPSSLSTGQARGDAGIPGNMSRATTSESHRWTMPTGTGLNQNNPNHPPRRASGSLSTHGAHTDPINTSASVQSDPASARYLEQIQGWQILSQQVTDMENLVNQSIIPSVDMMFRVRTQLQNMLVERQNQDYERVYTTPPSHRLFPSTAGAVEGMIARVTRLYERVDQITLAQQAHRIRQGMNNPSLPQTEPSRIYLATHPDGRQSLILPPETTIRTSVEDSMRFSHTATAPAPPLHPNPANAAAVQNAVRQVLVNQQQRRDANGAGAGRYLRRVWMFIRMYFFCYMVSDSGTWTRILLVTCAVLIAILSDTDIPQQLYGAIVAPAQRHLEGLAHMGGPADQSTHAPNQGGENPNNTAQQGMPGEILQFLRRAERSIVLLLASLIPGVGERQVEARNAAEAERIRREEQEQEQERERQQGQEGESQGENENRDGTEQTGSGAAAVPSAPPEQPEQAVA